MKEPKLKLVEDAIGASFGQAAELIPAREFNAAVKVAARAALAAMREPTDDMVAALWPGEPDYQHMRPVHKRQSAVDGWRAMLDAALHGA